MTSMDKNGRPYLKISEATDGMRIELDGGFTCIEPCTSILHKDKDSGRFYFDCGEGHHFINGQADDGEHCIGIYPL